MEPFAMGKCIHAEVTIHLQGTWASVFLIVSVLSMLWGHFQTIIFFSVSIINIFDVVDPWTPPPFPLHHGKV